LDFSFHVPRNGGREAALKQRQTTPAGPPGDPDRAFSRRSQGPIAGGRISKLSVASSAGILPASGGSFHLQTHRLEVDAARSAGKMPALRSGRCDRRPPEDAPIVGRRKSSG